MTKPFPSAVQPGRPASPRTYRILATPSGDAAGFLVIETAPDGREITLLACATQEEARQAKTAMEQLDAAEARARRQRPTDRR